nr:hypothetical protein [Parabacteroides distasonis]
MTHTVYPLCRINGFETAQQTIHRHAPDMVMLQILVFPLQHTFAQKGKPRHFPINKMHFLTKSIYTSVLRFQCFNLFPFIKPQVHDADCQQAHQ